MSIVAVVLLLLCLQEKAESFALYKQQLSIGLNVLVTLLTAAIVGYALGRHFIDVNNKAGVSQEPNHAVLPDQR